MDLKKPHLETGYIGFYPGGDGGENFFFNPGAGTEIRLKGDELEARKLVVEVNKKV